MNQNFTPTQKQNKETVLEKEDVNPEVPEKFSGLQSRPPAQVAGGMGAVISAMKYIFGDVGLVKGGKAMLRVNQKDGFDCPGCAWPDPDGDRSKVEFCENGAKAIAEEATKKRVSAAFFQNYSVGELSSWTDYEIGKSGRLTEPMIVRKGKTHYEPISWEEAFSLIGSQLRSLKSPDEAIFYTSGRTSNEAAFMYQLLARKFGTNNLPDCSNMCHESSGVALTETVGIGKGSVKLEDLYIADLIIISGQNPGTNHPRMLAALEKAKQKGCKIITINPLMEAGLLKFKHPQHAKSMMGEGTVLTDLYLQVKINGDVALMKAILKILKEKELETPGSVFDDAFITDKTEGFEALLADLDRYDTEELVSASGVPMGDVLKAAEMIAGSEKIIACWAMGLTQHKNAVDNIREMVNLLLLKGSIGKPGAGTCPVRGHSNVQGDRTMGIYEKPQPAFLAKLEEVFGFEPPKKHGYDTVESIEAMLNDKANFFMGMGGNFLSATPDTLNTAKGLQNCKMTVQVSTKLNRSHLIHGETALILPCLGRTEVDVQKGGRQFISVENSTGVVHQSQGGMGPASKNCLSEPNIIAEIAVATFGEKDVIDWRKLYSDYDNVRNLIEKTIPGFDHYNQRVRRPGGFYLPNGAREGNFNTLSGKAEFTLNELPDYHLDNEEFLMMTIRSHDQYNTTIYGLDDRYRGIYQERRVVLMNKQDMKRLGLTLGRTVDLFSNYDGKRRMAKNFLVIPYEIPLQCIATYFPEANVLIPFDQFAKKSQTPISKSVIVKVSF